MASAGFATLALSTLAALLGTAVGLTHPGNSKALRGLQLLTLAACAVTFAALASLVARGDVSVAYALEHRAPPDSPLGYRIAAVWAGQAGGLLLWALETALIALALRPARHPRAVAVLFAIQTCLLGLALAGNPFRAAASADAAGLNPLLQHPMMLIHPPLLFLGYALLAVPYAITLGALMDGAREEWVPTVWPWLLVSWLALTAGNGFGAEWAYKTFGWGGFWSWDPVENTSFVPWILSAVAVHCLWLAGRGVRAHRAAAACALGAFIAVLYGSFLARSGLLSGASVHAYVAGERLMQWALGGLLTAASLAAAASLAVRWRVWEGPCAQWAPALAPMRWGAGIMLAIAVLVLMGMSLPLLGQAPQTVAYNTFLMPLGTLLLVLLALASLRPRALPNWVSPLVCGVVAGLVGVGLAISLVVEVPEGYARVGAWLFAPLMVAAAAAVAALALRDVVACRRSLLHQGHAVAHLGVALLLGGALISGYGVHSGELFLQPGAEQSAAGHRVLLREVRALSRERMWAQLVVDGRPGTVEVERNPAFNSDLRRAFIRRGLGVDVYVTPLALVPAPMDWEGQRIPVGAMVQVSSKPLMSLVWTGMILIAAGQVLAILGRRRPQGQ